MDAEIQPKFSWALPIILHNEGGLVDDPQDPGGITNLGIALNEHPELTRADIINMTPQRAGVIYLMKYWKPIDGDDLPRELSLCVFDAAVMSGVLRAARWLQQVVEVTVDGHIGPATIAAARDCEPAAACRAYTDTRMAFLRGLKGWPHDGRGWENRVLHTLTEALA